MNSRFSKLVGIALTGLLAAVLLAACQPVQAAPAARSASDIAEQVMGIRQSVVVNGVGPSQAADPAQAQAEDEFIKVAMDKEQAFYDGDAARYLSYYADNMVSVQPGVPDFVGKASFAEATAPYITDNNIVGKLTIERVWFYGDHATRQAQWEEVVEPKAGGSAEHHIGRCTLNWEKVDGKWEVVSEYINYLDPPTQIQ
jgi:ketosteroid isomerase-like protein